MFSKQVEDVLYKLGYQMAKAKKPLGFINSAGFNKGYRDLKPVEQVKNQLMTKALRFYNVKLPEEQVKKDLILATYLMSNTLCYVGVSAKADSNSFTTSEVTFKCGSLDKELIEKFVGEFTTRNTNAYNRLLDTFTQSYLDGYLNFAVVNYQKSSVTFPRNKPNFLTEEYTVLPASLVTGYAQGLRDMMTSSLITVQARKSGGQMRDFTLTSQVCLVEKVYGQGDVLSMFNSLRPKQPEVDVDGVNVHLWTQLHNMNFLFYELGIPADQYPKRNLNLGRIQKLVVHDDDSANKVIREKLRYVDVDEDDLIKTVLATVIEWGIEKQEAFMVETLGILKEKVNTLADTSVTIKGKLDFQMKFNKTIEIYSTQYLHAIVDYLLRHQVEFKGYTGRRSSAKDVAETLGIVPTEEVVTVADDFDLDFDI